MKWAAILFVLLFSMPATSQVVDSVVTTIRIVCTDGKDTVTIRFPVSALEKDVYRQAWGAEWRERVSDYLLRKAVLPMPEAFAERQVDRVLAERSPALIDRVLKARSKFYFGRQPTATEASP